MNNSSWRPRAALSFLLVMVGLLAACAQDAGADNVPSSEAEPPPSRSPDEPAPVDPTQEAPSASPVDPGNLPATTPILALVADPFEAALAYAQCIRANGFEEWPDPEPDGRIMIRRDQGMDFNDPRRQAAMQACQALRPPGTGAGMGVGPIGFDQEAMLEFARCMRGNGVTEFPDPGTSGGPVIIGQGSGIDPNDPTFRAALEICRAELGH